MLKEFKAFALRGNVMDMAVGIIIGAAFGAIVNSLVNDIIMPPIGLLLGQVDFKELFVLIKNGNPAGPYNTIVQAKAAGAVTFNYGLFVNTIITFIIIAGAVFMLVKIFTSLEKKEEEKAAEPVVKKCPHCYSTIDIKATKCAYCTAEIQ